MSKYSCLVFLLLAVVIVNSQPSLKLFGTKTRYNDVSSKDIQLLEHGYEPSKAFLLIRHATSSSTPFVNTKMRDMLKEYQNLIDNTGKKLDSEVQTFLQWSPAHRTFDDDHLLPVGVNEMTKFAFRLKSKLPKLFGNYDSRKYPIISNPTGRVTKSARVFLNEVFKNNTFSLEEIPVCTKQNLVLMSEHGRKVDPQQKKFDELKDKKHDDFLNSKDFQSMKKRFATKLGLEEKEITFDFLNALWEVCRWDRVYSLEENVSICPCNLFQDEDVKVMLIDDYGYWWVFASPSVIAFNGKLSCGMIDHLSSFLKSDGNGPIVPLYFANRSNVLLMHMALGLDQDERSFTTSYTMPFIANFLAVVYQKQGSEPYVGIYFNENLTKITLLDGTSCEFCVLSKVIDKLDKYLQDNNCEELVSKANTTGIPVPYHYTKPAWVN